MELLTSAEPRLTKHFSYVVALRYTGFVVFDWGTDFEPGCSRDAAGDVHDIPE